MTKKLFYWADNLEAYSSDNDNEYGYDEIIEIKRLNFFIGKNNAGKSRFLREIFKIQNEQILYNSEQFRKLKGFVRKEILENKGTTLHKQKYDQIYELYKEFNSSNFSSLHPLFRDFLSKLSNIAIFKNLYPDCNIDLNTQNFKKEIKDEIPLIFLNTKFYIPILRGMRPVTDCENKYPFIERAQKDYFSNKEKFNYKNIITGECLYHELKVHLLGEPEHRELIKSYEEKLSQYFFDNEPVSLIPKHDQDVVNIKIGNDLQFPISQLGDGLQEAIILTYEAFINRKEVNSFFIEEPELHMHAGMVRQLMNFYLNETSHYYFFTTHSNHLVDMADESDQVMIQKFVKQPKKEDPTKFDFKIYRCDRDRDLLASLGVRPSSVYLANCTIWVEGITDRLYITKYMEKYLSELKCSDQVIYKKYRRFMPNYHYTFVEYAGSNLTHWSFEDNYVDHLKDKGLSAKAVASEMLLIADGDIQDKADRVKNLIKELTNLNFFKFKSKEIENTLPKESIIRVAKSSFYRKQKNTIEGFKIERLDELTDPNYFDSTEWGIGKLIDRQIRNSTVSDSRTVFADGTGVGTIKYKTEFCRQIIKDFDENHDWKLTPKARQLCERIFKHIEKCNSN